MVKLSTVDGTPRTERERALDREPHPGAPAVLAFADFELDADRFELRHGEARVAVQPKPLALLLYLARHRERLVPREELVAHLWPDVVVSDDALFHALKMAREAVGDRGRHQSVIETVRGVGFRFVAAIQERTIVSARRVPSAARGVRQGEELPLLGRQSVLERARGALDEASQGRGRLLLLEGEAGVGKTRLLDAIADAARARGARVARGVCREVGGAAFAPWSQALESLLAASSDAEIVRWSEGENGAWLAQVVPTLRERLPSIAAAEWVEDPGAESRWRLFEAVTRVLATSAATQPLVVLLDDLHWADAASLRLLEFLLPDLRERAILLVGAHRDERSGPSQGFTALIGEAARLDAGEALPIGRLSSDDVGQLLATLVGQPPAAQMVEAVHARTSGNPFFVVQLAREISARIASAPTAWADALAGVPSAVRQVVSGRLARLGERTRDVLALAAVAGPEFDVGLVQRAWERVPNDVLDALEEASNARLLEEAPGAIGRLRFVHALIHEGIFAELSSLRRARLHRALGEALEASSAHEADPPAAALAHHYFEAVSIGAAEPALRWSIRAGDTAMRRTAYEEAVGHFERAVALLGSVPIEPLVRYELLLALGRARHFGLGDYVRARQSFLAAAALARELGDAARHAEAALAYAAIPQSSVPEVEAPCRAVLDEALAAQPPDAALARARLLARLGAFLANEPRLQADAVDCARRALATAREVHETRTTLEALLALNRALRLQDQTPPAERLAICSESAALAGAIPDPVLETIARGQRIGPLLELGRGEEVDAEVERYVALAERLRVPALGWLVPVLRAAQHLLHGELARVEATALAALPIAARVPGSVAPGVLAALLFVLRREQGRLAEIEGAMRGLVERYAAVPGPRAWLALLLSECGRADEARLELDRFAREGLGSHRGTEGWRPSLAMLGEACVALGDIERAAPLYAELLPVERHALVLGDGIMCLGPAGRVLGSLAALLGRWDESDAHFGQAYRLCDGLRAPTWAARTRADQARALLRRGR